MTFKQFNELPAELRLKIFSCCEKKELKNIALVNKQCRDEVRPFIWASLKLSWHRLETLNAVANYKESFRHTKQIVFTGGRSCFSERIKQGYKSFPFYQILTNCNSDEVRKLVFQKFMIAGGLQLASENLSGITDLALDTIEAVGRSWDFICSFYCLKVLKITDCNVKDEHFAGISDLKTLQVLEIHSCARLSGHCLAYINEIASGLTLFEFQNLPHITGRHYTYLTSLKNVKQLFFPNTMVNDDFFIRSKGQLKQVTVLDVSETQVTDLSLPSISTFCLLEDIDLYECDISDEGLKYVVMLERLSRLRVAACSRITDQGLTLISKMKKLTDLNIHHCGLITDQGLVSILNLRSLTSLDIYGCHLLTNATLELVSKRLNLLEYIDVSCKKFTIDGLNHLLTLPRLKDVDYDLEEIDAEDIQHFFSRLERKCG